jgi:cell division initiation protein
VGDFDRHSAVLSEPVQRRSRLAELGDRLAGAFSPSIQRPPSQLHGRAPGSGGRVDRDPPVGDPHALVDPDTFGDPHTPAGDQRMLAGDPPTEAWDEPPAWDDSPPRFPFARDGYDRPAVDEYVSDLEQELNALDKEIVKLREQSSQPSEVTSEIQRVGEQTSAILIAAHEQAQQTTREAQEQADKCITDAAAKALSMTKEAKEELAAFGGEKESLRQERARLVGDVRRLSSALATLADEADRRVTPEDAEGPAGGEGRRAAGGQEADQPRAAEEPSA